MKDDIVIVAAARTPVGAFNGAFASLAAHELGKVAIQETLKRADVDGAQQAEDEEEHMLAEAGRSDPNAPRRDPEEAALELLQNELGARRIDGG